MDIENKIEILNLIKDCLRIQVVRDYDNELVVQLVVYTKSANGNDEHFVIDSDGLGIFE